MKLVSPNQQKSETQEVTQRVRRMGRWRWTTRSSVAGSTSVAWWWW